MGDKLIFICDFDGTISVKDVNVSIFRHFGNAATEAIENKYRNSEIGLREELYAQYEIIGINQEQFESFVMEKMELDETFFDFYDYARDSGIEVMIVSGGFINYVELLFKKYNRKLDMPIISNRLDIVNGIVLPKYGATPHCIKSYGPCGICKYEKIMKYKEGYKVAYVGDGHTDRCAAESADIVFAKSHLEKFCQNSGIEYVPYNTFGDIKKYAVQNMI